MSQAVLKTIASPILHAVKNKMPETIGIAIIDEKKAVGIVLDNIGGPTVSASTSF